MTILPPEQQSSGSNTRFTRGKSAEKTKEAVRPHAKIPHEDLDWVLTQSPTVMRLFMESWRCESFGKQWRSLKTKLQKSNLYAAMKVLENAGLFIYEPIHQKGRSGQRKVVGWKCQNSHGYYTSFWDEPLEDLRKVSADSGELSADSGELSADSGELSADTGKVSALNGKLSADSGNLQPETRSMTEPVENQPRFNHVLTTPLPPTKVVEGGSCISQETQQTPLGGAAATSGEMQEEEEDAPDTSTASVEDKLEVNGTPTDLGEDQSSGGGDITTELFSDVNYTEFPFQVGSQVTINWPNTEHDGKTGIVEKLYWEALEVDVQLKGVLAVFCFPMARILGSSVAPSTKVRFNLEHAQNRKVRQSRLKCADVLGECPGAEFLTECWQDILLRSQVKALIAKYPQWGIFANSADQLQSWFD